MANPLRFDPTQPGSLLGPIQRPLEVLDLPKARSAILLRHPARIAHYGLVLEDDRRVLLQVALDELDGNGFYAHIAASRLAEGEAIPFVRPAVALPWAALGGAAIVSSPPLGAEGQQAIKEGLVDRVTAFRKIGELLAEVSDVPAPTMGTLATADGFRPRRGTWAEEWMARVHRLAAVARARGTAPPLLVNALLDRIDPSVLTEEVPVLVHGGLDASAVYWGDDGSVVGILGWEDSWTGDPLSGFGPLLHLPTEGLAVVLEGYGRPVDAGRLAVYEATFALQLLASASMGAVGPLRAAARVERAADVVRLALSDTLEARLRQAEHAGAAGPGPISRGHRNRIRAATEALRLEPAAPDGGQIWQIVAATTVLAHDVGPTPYAPGWLEVADKMLTMLPLGLVPRPSTDLPDTWWADQWAQSVDSAAALDDGPIWADPIVLLGTAFSAAHRLAGAIDATTLAGLEDLLAGARLRQRTGRPAGSAQQLMTAILGLGALRVLAPPFGAPAALETLRTRLREQARVAWDVFEVTVAGDPPTPKQVIAHFSVVDHHANQATPVAPLLLALRAAEPEDLPAAPGALLTALGVHP